MSAQPELESNVVRPKFGQRLAKYFSVYKVVKEVIPWLYTVLPLSSATVVGLLNTPGQYGYLTGAATCFAVSMMISFILCPPDEGPSIKTTGILCAFVVTVGFAPAYVLMKYPDLGYGLWVGLGIIPALCTLGVSVYLVLIRSALR